MKLIYIAPLLLSLGLLSACGSRPETSAKAEPTKPEVEVAMPVPAVEPEPEPTPAEPAAQSTFVAPKGNVTIGKCPENAGNQKVALQCAQTAFDDYVAREKLNPKDYYMKFWDGDPSTGGYLYTYFGGAPGTESYIKVKVLPDGNVEMRYDQ